MTPHVYFFHIGPCRPRTSPYRDYQWLQPLCRHPRCPWWCGYVCTKNGRELSMSGYQGKDVNAGQQPARKKRRPGRWVLASSFVAGSPAAGAAGLTGAANQTGLAGLNRPLSKVVPSSGHAGRGQGGKDYGSKDGDQEPRQHGPRWHGRGRTRVACAPDALVAAINVANADDGGTLKLAPNCTYALTANQCGNGLSVATFSASPPPQGSALAPSARTQPAAWAAGS
jgi:hypothetical protein